MKNFKASLDRVEGDIAVLLVRDEESIKIDFPCPFFQRVQEKGIFWILLLKRIRKKQGMRRREWHL